MMETYGAALVTGATGFIGRNLVRRLLASGVRTTCLVRGGDRARRLGSSPHLALIDVSAPESRGLRAAIREASPEVVFHLASYGVDPTHKDEAQLAAGNAGLTGALVEAVADSPPRRFLFTGSCSEYARAEGPALIQESHAIAPASPYGAAKAAAEREGTARARELGVPFVTLRLFGVYGPGEADYRIVPYLVERLRRGESPSLTEGRQVRDMMHVDDTVAALLLAAASPRIEALSAYNVCTGKPVTIRAFAEEVARAIGKPGADLGLGKRPYREHEPMWLVGDPSRFAEAAGFRPALDVAEGVRRAVAAMLAEGES